MGPSARGDELDRRSKGRGGSPLQAEGPMRTSSGRAPGLLYVQPVLQEGAQGRTLSVSVWSP